MCIQYTYTFPSGYQIRAPQSKNVFESISIMFMFTLDELISLYKHFRAIRAIDCKHWKQCHGDVVRRLRL